jgi:hypothetical protein
MKLKPVLSVILVLCCVSCVQLKVTEVKFNHDSGNWNDDALNIRKNFSATVAVPEWVAGETDPQDSPAAYVGDRKVTVLAKFVAKRDGVYTCYTKGGPFQLKKTQVHIQGGVSNPAWVPFESTHIGPAVKVTDAKWGWKRKFCWICSRTFSKTRHRFYVVKEVPKDPWKQTPFPNTQNPWTDALDFSCKWASGQTTQIGVMTKVTENLNAGPYAYDQVSGASFYSTWSPRKYNLTAFLDRLNGGIGNGSVLNCTDCGMSATTFANLLGSELWSSRMFPTAGSGFALNQIVAVGYATFACPGFGCGFSYHEVGWTGNALAGDRIYDPCLKVDGDGDPVNAPHTALLPVNMIFDDPAGLDYHERLVPPPSLSNCQAQPSTKIRAPVF